MGIRSPILALVLFAVTPAAPAEPHSYRLDPVHTRVGFLVEHAGFSRALGSFAASRGTLVFDPNDWSSARLDATIPLRCLELGSRKWEKATLARNLLNLAEFPEAHFVSTRVEPTGQDDQGRATAKVTGDLTLRGVTRPVTLDVRLNALRRHPMPPFRRTAGFSATGRLSRADFGITAWKNVIGDEVELIIEAEATRARGAADEDAPGPAAGDAAQDDAGEIESPTDSEQLPEPEDGR